MSSKKRNVVVERTAKKLDIPEYLVTQVVASFFSVVVEDIESGTYRGSYCRRLGKFVIKPKRLQMLEEKKLKKQQNGNTVRDNRGEGTDTSKLSNDTNTQTDLG